MGALAFFPWLRLRDRLKVGAFELLPYQHGKPFSAAPSTLPAVHAILQPYWMRWDVAGRHSAILRRDGRGLLDDVNEADIEELYRFAEYVAFAGLARRRYFGHDRYWNRDHFRLIVQKFDLEQLDGTAMVSRRRDGNTTTLASRKYFKVIRPEHVHDATVSVDEGLLRVLATEQEPAAISLLYDAIVTFNLANTDAAYTLPHVELVLSANAFQRALDCRTTNDAELGERLANALTPSVVTPLSAGRLSTRQSQLPQAATVREVWVRDMYRLRNDLGHGKVTPRYPAVWSITEHLLLAAFSFPLLVKSILSSAGAYVLTSDDEVAIDAFERLAASPEPMAWDPSGTCAWAEIIGEVSDERAMAEALKHFEDRQKNRADGE
jgi:hypothetical protein